MKTLSAICYVAFPKLVAGGGQIVLNLFLIRHFRPAEFGALSVCLTALLLFDSFLGSAIDMAVLRLAPLHAAQGDIDESHSIQKAALLLKPLAIAIISIPVIVFSSTLSRALFQRRDFGYFIVLTMFALAAVLFLRSVQTYFQIERRFNWYGGTDFAHNLVRYGVVACGVYTGFGTPGLVLAVYAITPLIIGTILLAGPARVLFTISTNWIATRKLASVLAWFVPAAVVGGLTSRMDVFFVSHLSGVGEAGVFSAAQVVAMPVLLLGTYLSVVFGPRIMPQVQDGSFSAFYRNFQLFIISAAAISYGLLLSLKVWLSASMFPPRFQQAWPILIVLFPSVLAGLVSFPLTISLLLFLKPRFLFLVDACAIPILCAAYYLLGPRYGAIGVAGVTTTYSMLKLGILQIAAWRLLRRQDKQRASDLCGELEFSEG